MFLWNNIFFSLGFDVKDHYKDFGGDFAAYVAPVSCFWCTLAWCVCCLHFIIKDNNGLRFTGNMESFRVYQLISLHDADSVMCCLVYDSGQWPAGSEGLLSGWHGRRPHAGNSSGRLPGLPCHRAVHHTRQVPTRPYTAFDYWQIVLHGFVMVHE